MLLHALGAVAVAGTGGLIEVRGARQSGLLALLAVNVGRSVPQALLEQELWAGRPVSDAAVRVTANRLRRTIGAIAGRECIETSREGYRLTLDDTEIDIGRYLALLREAQHLADGHRLEEALASHEEAQRLWRGRPFARCDDLPSIRPAQERLLLARRDAGEHRVGLLVELGDHRRALGALDLLIAEDRYHERLWALRMCALYGAGRQRDALNAYQDIRRILDTEVGIAPGATLRSLEAAMLEQAEHAHVARLAGLPGSGLGDRPPSTPTAIRAATPGFVGRTVELDLLADRLLADPPEAHIAVIEAGAGLGKTRLAVELTALCPRPTREPIRLSCRRGQPELSTVIDLVAAATESAGDGDRVGGDRLPTDEGTVTTPVERDIDVTERRIRLQVTAVRQLREAFRESGSPLVVLDDLQWIDDESAAVLGHLMVRLEDVRWLVLSRVADRSDAAQQLLQAVRARPCLRLALTPLTAEDIHVMARQLGAAAHADIVAEQASGSPLLAAELCRHLAGGGELGPAAPGIGTLVAVEMDRLPPAARDAVMVLAVADRPLPLPVLAAALPDLARETLTDALARAADAGLVTVRGDEIGTAHDLIAQAVHSRARPGEVERAHHDLGQALLGADLAHGPLRALGHLLDAGALATPAELDAAAAAGLRGLLVDDALAAVVRLGERYLAHQGTAALTRDGLEARTHLAGALFGTGATARGAAILDAIEPRLQRLGDVTLLVDAFLARHLSEMITSDADLVAEGILLLDVMPAHEVDRRCVLAGWAAHHLVNLDRPAEATTLLARARFDASRSSDDNLWALLLWLEYEVAGCRTGTPDQVRGAYERIRRFADLSDDPFIESTALTCEADHTLRFGSVAAYGDLVERLEAATAQVPRADMRWFAAAVATAHEIARGDLVAAQAAIERSSDLGSRLPTSTTGGVLVQWVQLWWERGDLKLQRNILPAEPSPELGTLLLCGFGLTCLQGDDHAGARAAAEALDAIDPVLPVAYHPWCFTAVAAAEIADATHHARLGERLVEALTPHAGTGLSAAGIAYLGLVEGSMGRARAAAGDVDGAVDLLVTAFEGDRERGAPLWAARWAGRAADLLGVRGRAGDTATADRLRAEHARLLGSAES